MIGTPESRTEILKEAEANPIKMGDTIIKNSKSEKYLGDQIQPWTPTAKERGDTILSI